jgi:tripartite-type tricarboxylate transporter receptor subunit TctC
MYFGNFSEVVPHGKSGRVNILGVSTDKRDRQLPETPAINETYNGFRTVTWNGLVAPAGTPRDILDRIALEIQKGLKDPQLIDRLHRIGVDPWGSSPAEFSDAIRKDYELYRDVVKTAGIKAE